jgi:hypothetical protein
MDSDILANQNIRNDRFKKNPKLDVLIEQLRQVLEPAENQFVQKHTAPLLPVVLVVGNSRSGSTLLTQVLAACGDFSYPTNVLNRFAYAPAIGAMIQQMLFNKEYAYLNELADVQSSGGFNSQLGKTAGAMDINEFYHFWRRFIPNYDLGYLDDKEPEKIDIYGLRRELAALEAIFEKPFMCKGKAIQYNIHAFADRMPELFFIHIERDPLYVMQSILLGRRKFYQSDAVWFGVKPKEYQELKNMDIYHQIAGQVLFTDRTIHTQLAALASSRGIHCRYEDLCANPSDFYDRLASVLSLHGCNLTPYPLDDLSFPSSNVQKLDSQELLSLQAAYDELKTLYDGYS